MKTAHKAQILPELALEDRYFSVLEEHLQGASESTLRRAYDLGRKALSDGRSLLEMATLHHIALVRILARPDSSSAEPKTLEAAYQFFAECISPYEMTHRGFMRRLPLCAT